MASVILGPNTERYLNVLLELDNYLGGLIHQVTTSVGHHSHVPNELQALSEEVKLLQRTIKERKGRGKIDLSALPLSILAAAVARRRRQVATELADQRRRARAADVLRKMQDSVDQVDRDLESDWYQAAVPLTIPRLRDYVAVEHVREDHTGAKRDDKFGILFSASMILNDLASYRDDCEERGAPLTVAFIDVDGLKQLNREYGETSVDELVLPKIMRAVDQIVFGHGRAYRHGGDEFVVLSPSADETIATAILSRMMRVLADTSYALEIPRPTVSIGICVVHPDAPLTNGEAIHWAARAKQAAKEAGRNRIAVVNASTRITNIRKPQPVIRDLPG